ncbi:MAG TPA: PAS domain S-box protein [Steroidobacteraceae bacterium]|nr:PAS domain S-box protein [Steroidobacteraceae bacterium]
MASAAAESPALALQGSDFGFWELDVAADEVAWHGDWYAALRIDPCLGPNHIARWAVQIHPQDNPPMTLFRELLAGRIDLYEAEYRIRTQGGAWRWISTRARAVSRDAGGRAVRVAGVTLDIDARKRAEIKLRETETRLETALWGTQIGVWDNLREGEFRWLNDWCPELDLDPCTGPAGSARWRSLIHPEDRALVERAWEPRAAGRAGTYVIEYRIRTLKGAWRWVHERGRVTACDAAGRATAFVGICIDVDARKRMEIELQSQAKILETMREGVALVDAAGRIEFTNPAFERMVGQERGALVGTHAIDVLSARVRGRAQREATERLLRRLSGRGGERTVLLRRADGTQFAAEVLSSAIDWKGERKMLFVVQDVSERKRLENEITEVAHLERQRLGSDLHDGLSQELTGIALLLRGIEPAVATAAPQLGAQIDEIIALTNQAIQSTRKMALGLSQVTIGRGGLVDALGTLVERTQARLGVAARLRLNLRGPLAIDAASETHLYLIAQEALTNACEHGRARHITVSLRVNRLYFSLSIVDDGAWRRPAPPPGRGLGLTIMHYRARAIGGTLQVAHRRSGGTRLRCVCPHAAPPDA